LSAKMPSAVRCVPMLIALLAVAAFVATPAGAQTITRIADINPGASGAGVSYVTEYAGALYFRANDLPHGADTELWKFDGAAASRVADLYAGPTGSNPSDLVVFDNKLYFCASANTGGNRLYYHDAATGQTVLAPGSSSQASLPQEMTVYNGAMYFRASRFGAPSNIGIELWKFDGTNQTPFDVYAGPGSSYPQHFIEYGGLLYFNACGTPGQGGELWRTNGTAVAEAARIYPNNGSSPENFVLYNDRLYFSAYDGVHGRELWSYNGATATLAADIVPGGQYSSSNPNNMAVYRDDLFFSAYDPDHGFELWKFDGAAASMVVEINPTPDPLDGDTFLMDSSPAGLVVYNDVLYFTADDGVNGRELWSYDGVEARLVADIYPGQYGSDIQELRVWGDSLYFVANDGQTGSELTVLGPAVYRFYTPEPATLALLAFGAAGMVIRRKSR
jgi:ELWxxDGT repeat protein